MTDVDYAALAEQARTATPMDYSALAEKARQESDVPLSSSALWFQGASKVLPVAERTVNAALASPSAPRVIQRAIGAGVRGASTAVGAAVGGVPGAVGGAAMSEGLTPTQATIRGWLGRTPTPPVPSTTGDAVIHYIESMGGDVTNLKGAALEYAKKAGRSILYDASGRASLVPSEAAATTAAPVAAKVGSSVVGKLSRGLGVLSAVQGGLDLAQMAEPNRRDIGFLGIGKSIQNAPLPADAQDAIYVHAVKSLIADGAAPTKAAAIIAQGDPSKFARVITAYSQSLRGQ